MLVYHFADDAGMTVKTEIILITTVCVCVCDDVGWYVRTERPFIIVLLLLLPTVYTQPTEGKLHREV